MYKCVIRVHVVWYVCEYPAVVCVLLTHSYAPFGKHVCRCLCLCQSIYLLVCVCRPVCLSISVFLMSWYVCVSLCMLQHLITELNSAKEDSSTKSTSTTIDSRIDSESEVCDQIGSRFAKFWGFVLYTQTHTNTHVYVCIYIYIYSWPFRLSVRGIIHHTYIHTYMHTYIHTYMRTYIHKYCLLYAYKRTSKRTHLHARHADKHTCVQTYINAYYIRTCMHTTYIHASNIQTHLAALAYVLTCIPTYVHPPNPHTQQHQQIEFLSVLAAVSLSLTRYRSQISLTLSHTRSYAIFILFFQCFDLCRYSLFDDVHMFTHFWINIDCTHVFLSRS